MKNNKQNLLLIFSRNPELGKCKTRLAAIVGDKTALDIYRFLLQHTAGITKNINAQKHLYYSSTIGKNDIWDNNGYDKKLQSGNDLGERMTNAFRYGFDKGFSKIMVIGSDMYDLSQDDLDDAFKSLDEHDYVIGPAEDGGYYLLGMKVLNQDIFKNKNWGNKTVLKDTLADLKNSTIKLLATKNDIDIYEDIKDIEVFEPFIKDIKI